MTTISAGLPILHHPAHIHACFLRCALYDIACAKLLIPKFLQPRYSFALDSGKSHRTATVKADLFLAGIAQLVGVLLSNALHKPQLIKSVRKLIA